MCSQGKKILGSLMMGVMKGCKDRLGATSISDIFCIYLVRKVLFVSGKSHRILRSDV